jgi:hypothetical protein
MATPLRSDDFSKDFGSNFSKADAKENPITPMTTKVEKIAEESNLEEGILADSAVKVTFNIIKEPKGMKIGELKQRLSNGCGE